MTSVGDFAGPASAGSEPNIGAAEQQGAPAADCGIMRAAVSYGTQV